MKEILHKGFAVYSVSKASFLEDGSMSWTNSMNYVRIHKEKHEAHNSLLRMANFEKTPDLYYCIIEIDLTDSISLVDYREDSLRNRL